MNADLIESQIVGDWHRQETPMFICPGGPVEPDECDCGFVGEWDHRVVLAWLETPGHTRSDYIVRRDVAKGWPARRNDEGYYYMVGYDERCPGCGDIERFDSDANQVAVNVSEIGRRRRAEHLRQIADELEADAGWKSPETIDDLANSRSFPEVGAGLRLVRGER